MGCTSSKTSANNLTPTKRINEILYWEADVWKLSGMPLDEIKRKFVKIRLEGRDVSIRTAIVHTNEKDKPNKKTLVLCCDYMDAAPSTWFPFVKDLSEHFRLVMPDLGTYGANTRIQCCDQVNKTGDVAERFIVDWWVKWVESMNMKKDLPDKFHLCGIANGGFQAGLYATYAPERIERLLIMSPSRFCPPPSGDFDPYILEMNLSEVNDVHEKKHMFDYVRQRSDAVIMQELKNRCLRMRPDLSEKEASIIAEYKVRILTDQDLAQVAYLKLFQPLGTSYNPLRS